MHCQCLFLFLLLTITSALDLTKWMSNLPDDLPLTLLSIPGTHNSLAYPKPRKPLIPSTQCQHLKLEQQLSKGVRFLDLRLQHHRDRLTIHHGIQYLSATFTDVLLYLLHFLSTNPSETIIIRAFHNNPRSSKRRNGCTRELWQTVQWYIEQWPEVFCETTWWGEDNTCHGRNAAEDFESPYPIFPITWRNTELLSIQDDWTVQTRSQLVSKINLVRNFWSQHLPKPEEEDGKQRLCINFLSAAGILWIPRKTAGAIYSALWKEIAFHTSPVSSSQGGLGIVVGDYVTEAVCRAIISNNFLDQRDQIMDGWGYWWGLENPRNMVS